MEVTLKKNSSVEAEIEINDDASICFLNAGINIPKSDWLVCMREALNFIKDVDWLKYLQTYMGKALS